MGRTVAPRKKPVAVVPEPLVPGPAAPPAAPIAPPSPGASHGASQEPPRLMAWKLATAFVLTTESWLGPERTHSGEEAVLSIGVSRHERLGVIRRVRKTPGVEFAPPEWLPADALDENYFRLLPYGQSIVTTEEATMLAAMFGEDGEVPARPLS
jgi:hypothetical protein